MKSLIVIIFIVSIVAAEELFCTPNSLFQQSCNSCVCSKDGKSAACTDMACPEERQQEKKYCEPGKQFQLDDISTCICSKDGKTAACTLGLQSHERSRHLAKNNEYCTPGSTFSPDNCNTCVCSQDGTNAMCTLQMCPVEQPKQACEPRRSFKDYCNTCFCDADGASYSCTRMLCDKNIWNQDGSMKIDVENRAEKQVCEPRRSFKDYCNTCFCDADGASYSCTRIFCDKRIWNQDGSMKIDVEKPAEKQVCEPRKAFKDYCNTCFCDADGASYSCTRMFCDKRIWNQDGSMKIDVEKPAEKQVCEPRKAFKDYCNTCVCSDDGLLAACTRMACDKKIWNADGTSKLLVRSDAKQVCEPHKTFKDYCNTCTCSADGLSAACTRMWCDKDVWNPDGSTKIMVKSAEGEVFQNQVCTPRSTFSPDGCNSCKCDEFGTDYVCTFKLCR